MILRYKVRGYDQVIRTTDNTIYFMDCTCWNFENRRLKKHGKSTNIKVEAAPCKHLSPIINSLLENGLKLKKYTDTSGQDKLTKELREKILRVWGNECFFNNCEVKENLEIHHLDRKSNGGKYSILNCRPYCSEHHKLLNSNEFSHVHKQY